MDNITKNKEAVSTYDFIVANGESLSNIMLESVNLAGATKSSENRDLDRVEFKEGGHCFVKKGTSKLHNEHGPALVTKKCHIWALDGILHREQEPAIRFIDFWGSYAFYKDGKLHNDIGPAVFIDGVSEYYLSGIKVSLNDIEQAKLQGITLVPKEFGYAWQDSKGNAHREDAPAIELNSGTKYWAKDGFVHREDGPAIESTTDEAIDGLSIFREAKGIILPGVDQNGKYVLYGFPFSEESFNEMLAEGLEVRLDPVSKDLNFFKDNELHRVAGPAIYGDTRTEWIQKGLHHRVDGPAIEYIKGGVKEYYLHGYQFSKDNFTQISNSYDFIYKESAHKLTFSEKGTSLIHCDFGPAVLSNNYVAWYKRGYLHREDGPAEVFTDDDQLIIGTTYALHGKKLTESAFFRWKDSNKDEFFVFDDHMLNPETKSWQPIKQILISNDLSIQPPENKIETAQLIYDNLSIEEKAVFDIAYDAVKIDEAKTTLGYGRSLRGVSYDHIKTRHAKIKDELFVLQNLRKTEESAKAKPIALNEIFIRPLDGLIKEAIEGQDFKTDAKFPRELDALKSSKELQFDKSTFMEEERATEAKKIIAEIRAERSQKNTKENKLDKSEKQDDGNTFNTVAAALLATLAAAAFKNSYKKAASPVIPQEVKTSEAHVYENQQR